MERLSSPCSYRFFDDQKAWLQDQAKKEGHRSEVVILRRLVEQAMRPASRKHKEVA